MNNDLVLVNLVTPLMDDINFANAPTTEELLLEAEAEDTNSLPDPIPDMVANTDHVPNVNPRVLTTMPCYTTPISYPVNILPDYIERVETPIPDDVTCLNSSSITPEIREQTLDTVSEAANVAAFWIYHVTVRQDYELSLRDVLSAGPSALVDSLVPPPTRTELCFPTDHPGEDWLFNHPSARRAYPFCITTDLGTARAKYIQYRRNQPIPMIDGTMGVGQPIFSEPLRLPHPGIAERALLTAPPQRVFDPGMLTSTVIDQTLEQLDDWALRAEVDRYRFNVDQLEAKHKTMVQLRAEIQSVTEDVHSSIYRLSQANAYQRIKDVLRHNDDVALFIPNSELRTHFRHVDSTPHLTDAYCTWCQTGSHDLRNCPIFWVCTYCWKYGHAEAKCYSPHKYCQSFCLVEREHPRYNQPCRSRPYLPLSPRDEARRRADTRQRRIKRRRERRGEYDS